MTDETRRDEDQPPDIEIEILWQHDRDGVWWAILNTGESKAKRAAASAPIVEGAQGRRRGALLLKSEREWLLTRIAEKPDLTLRGVMPELAERGTPASYGAVWRCFAREGVTFKKSLHANEQDRPDVALRRQRWKKDQGRLDPRHLVFIDETWAKTNMIRRCGRSPRGTRLVAKVPHRRWRTLTFLAALRCDRIEAPCVIDGPINGTSFPAYVEQLLVPTLGAGDIVIMDNLRSHKGQAVRQLKASVGAALDTGVAKPGSLERVSVDTTVQPKAIAHPTDSRLYWKALQILERQAKRHGIALRHSHTRLAKAAMVRAGRHAHARQFRRMRRAHSSSCAPIWAACTATSAARSPARWRWKASSPGCWVWSSGSWHKSRKTRTSFKEAAFLGRGILACATATLAPNAPLGALVGDEHLPIMKWATGTNPLGEPVLVLSVSPGIELTFQMPVLTLRTLGEALNPKQPERLP